MLEKLDIPQNFTINRICQDFLTYRTIHRYDLAVGNPPFSKLKERTPEIELSLASNANHVTNNLSEMFLEKCIRCSDCVALVLNKTLLSTEEFELIVKFCGMSSFSSMMSKVSMLSGSISTTSKMTWGTFSYRLKRKGMKLPAPTDGSNIRISSLLNVGKLPMISFTMNLLV